MASKKFHIDFNSAELAQYRIDVRHALYAVCTAKKIIDDWQPDRVLVYNGLYSVNRAVVLFAETRGIPAFFMHAGLNISRRLQSIMIGRGSTFSYFPQIKSQWKRFSGKPCTAKELGRVTDHMAELLNARSIFVYSAARSGEYFDVRKFFGVKKHQKLVVATLSSPDEYLAGVRVGALTPHEGVLFNSQVEWVEALMRFIKTRQDIFLVVRVHPREFPNRRDRQMSQHAIQLQSVLAELPDNAAVNWPDDNISIYDFANQTDVFLNAWSSVGKEMPAFGIPVVNYSSRLAWYPAELNYIGETLDTYFLAIDDALRDGWSFERVRMAYRWMVHDFVRSTIGISDSYSEIERPERSFVEKIYHRLMRLIFPSYIKNQDIRNRNKPVKEADRIVKIIESGAFTSLEQIPDPVIAEVSLEEETEALRKELWRLAHLLVKSPAARANSRLYKNMTASAAEEASAA